MGKNTKIKGGPVKVTDVSIVASDLMVGSVKPAVSSKNNPVSSILKEMLERNKLNDRVLEVVHLGRSLLITVTSNWYVNGTHFARFFGKKIGD
jgi:hypothetical protein